ncbi:MAG: Nuclear actin-protein involved in chromatin remodeling [Trizodia sp. TS-e1964]|nr:MAG: Nuclear actin-protein involved in chromatin remodeling [Trizodia sp. TS-e1964]
MVPSSTTQSRPASPKPPSRIWNVQEQTIHGYVEPQPDGYLESVRRGLEKSAIVIDNGSSATRAGWSFDKTPRLTIPPTSARSRDRKYNKTYTFVGKDVNVDTNARSSSKCAFETGSGLVSNWDVMENIMDYIFLKLGVDGADGGVGRPIVMTEPVANFAYTRKVMTEIIFECYSAPSLAYGIDSLFSFNYNQGETGLVISSSNSSTHVIPVVNSRGLLSQATRLNWGGSQSADYLLKLLQLKYPNFQSKFSSSQAEDMVREHCYLSQDYQQELSGYLESTGLEDRDHIVQYPFTEQVVVQKSEEELTRIAEKRKESGRRLQEQAAKARLEKLIRKERELENLKEIHQKIQSENKKETRRLLDENNLKDEAQLEKVLKELDKSIRKARTKDVGGEFEEEDETPTFPLLDIPDDQLDEAGIKQKRHQRLMKSNVEARARAKAEKERVKAEKAEEERLDQERREKDLEGWLGERRAARIEILQKIKDRQRLKADLGNRKSLASQNRMKTLADLASDRPNSKKRRRGGDEDTFGANDDDWGVYRAVAAGDQSDDDEDEELSKGLKLLEAQLLQHDPDFTLQNTLEAQSDWRKSLMHAFLRGPWPYDAESQRESHQIHLNVERIRVPEVVFQPSIAGLDQAGIVEIAFDILSQRISNESQRSNLLKDIFLTGGNTMFQGFDDRLRSELRAVLPAGAPLRVRTAKDAILDAWKGAAKWAGGSSWKAAAVTREEYLEKGSEYMKVAFPFFIGF